jgi:D-alanine-D-alanine ligase
MTEHPDSNENSRLSVRPTHFSSHFESTFRGKRIGLAVDVPIPLDATAGFPFPHDATAEWETSETIERIRQAWLKLGFEVVPLALDARFWSHWEKNISSLDLVHSLVEGWGSPAREGWIPSLCELAGIPCIGSSPLAQGIAMRKSLLKILCREVDVPTADFFVVRTREDCDAIPSRLTNQPHFLKPDCEGSGMGVDASTSVSHSADEARGKAHILLERFPDGVLVETLLPGEELTTALLGHPLRPLPPARIEVEDGVYGLANKSKAFMGEKVTFPTLTATEERSLVVQGLALAHAAGFEDFVRLDWKRDSNGVVTFMEANPLAGLSYFYSVLPKIAAQGGLSYESLLANLAASALERQHHRRHWYGRARLR